MGDMLDRMENNLNQYAESLARREACKRIDECREAMRNVPPFSLPIIAEKMDINEFLEALREPLSVALIDRKRGHLVRKFIEGLNRDDPTS